MFVLPESLTIHNVREVQEALLSFLAQSSEEPDSEMIIDMANVRDFDAAGLQLILSAYQTFFKEGRPCRLINVQALEQWLDLTGAGDILRNGGVSR